MTIEEYGERIKYLTIRNIKASAKINPAPFPPIDNEFCESCIAPTPSGGDYSTAYFYDAEGNPCKRADAVFMNVVEYTKDGRRINETYGKSGR